MPWVRVQNSCRKRMITISRALCQLMRLSSEVGFPWDPAGESISQRNRMCISIAPFIFNRGFEKPKRVKHRHTIAFVDFFDEETRTNGGNWKKVVDKYLFSGNEPLVNGILGGRESPNSC